MYSQDEYEFLIKEEIVSEAYYNKKCMSPVWPGGASGITIGIGYDLGYKDKNQFLKDWGHYLKGQEKQALAKVLGIKGSNAQNLQSKVKFVKISFYTAKKVFTENTLPQFINKTKRIFPGCQNLHRKAFQALVSLVYNRGDSLSGTSRQQMMNIHQIFQNWQKQPYKYQNIYQEIANQVRNMKRLHKEGSQNYNRRLKEAKIIQDCGHHSQVPLKPKKKTEDQIIGQVVDQIMNAYDEE